MRRLTQSVLALACLSFFAIQVSGSHLHAEKGVHDAAQSHGVHLQNAFHDDQDHDVAHVDISVFEYATNLSKVDSFITASTINSIVPTAVIGHIGRESSASPIQSRGSRWRPPSRAPPSL